MGAVNQNIDDVFVLESLALLEYLLDKDLCAGKPDAAGS